MKKCNLFKSGDSIQDQIAANKEAKNNVNELSEQNDFNSKNYSQALKIY